MRDKIVTDKNYFLQFEKDKNLLILNTLHNLENGIYAIDNIPLVKYRLFKNSLEKFIGQYSAGVDLNVLKIEYEKLIDLMVEGWDEFTVKFKMGRPQIVYDQYSLNEYCYMIWMISFSILLDINQNSKDKLLSLIKRDNIKDELIIMLAKIDLNPISKCTYKPFKDLSSKIKNFKISELDIIKYLNNWFKNTKLLQWHNYSNSINKSTYYFGTWCFEVAAIVVMFDLDDSSFRNHEYYPSDLVDFYKKNHIV